MSSATRLNDAFRAWVTVEYNNKVHGETGQTPLDRWRAGIMDALAAVAMDFYGDALDRYPSLLYDAGQEPDDEALVVWRVLMALDELAVAAHAAMALDDAQRVPISSCSRSWASPTTPSTTPNGSSST